MDSLEIGCRRSIHHHLSPAIPSLRQGRQLPDVLFARIALERLQFRYDFLGTKYKISALHGGLWNHFSTDRFNKAIENQFKLGCHGS
jgi:hypothetical protein